MKTGIVLFLTGLVLLSSCSLQSLDDTEGVAWEYFSYYSDLVAGPVLMDNLVLVADSDANVIAVNKFSGTLNWFRTLSNHQILALYSDFDYLYVISSSNTSGYISRYDILQGEFKEELALGLIPGKQVLGDYALFGSHYLILHDSDSLVRVTLDTLGGLQVTAPQDLSAYISDCVAVEGEDTDSDGLFNYYYLIGSTGTVLKIDSAGLTYQDKADLNKTYQGSSVQREGYLYLGTTEGVFRLSTGSLSALPVSDTTVSVSRGDLAWNSDSLFVPSRSISKSGITKYLTTGGLSEAWFFTTYGPVSHSPVVVDVNNNVVACVDDQSRLYVVYNGMDVSENRFIFDKFLEGTLPAGRLDIPIDESSYIYIAFANKLLAYSLEWAAGQQTVY